MHKKFTLMLTVTALLLGACSSVSGTNAAVATGGGERAGDRDRGRQVYKMNCAVCHGATGAEGGPIGPSLRGERERLDFSATVAWIEDPQAPMPKLYPKLLSKQQVLDVAAYVQHL
jgi:mono/diheme cytochrome c family protein